ncbi:hypothetical protein BB558_003404 [Smittium angustum]|uniref:V-type proton ATPase subunit G n=1 Tax=Smittium angustum TaxID=133377 RepID=A0A2U1J648_SMIAN|nr:hypothetical protein BB558_003404 [Smittium angustum]
MSSSNSQGIQALFDAEKEAAKIVEQARKYRVQRLKDAREEAAKEILLLQETKNKEVEKAQLSKSEIEQLELEMQKDTDSELQEIVKNYESNKNKAAELILEATVGINFSRPTI